MDTPRRPEPPPSSPRAALALGGALLLLNLAVAWLAWAGLAEGRRHYEAQARVDSRNLAQVLERSLSGQIQAIDLALVAVKREIALAKGPEPGRSRRIEAAIRDYFALAPGLDSLRSADAGGTIVHGIGVAGAPRASVSDRTYFQKLKEDPAAGLVISEPLVGRISGRRVVMLARRLEAPDGSFEGIVYGVITLEAFTRGLTLVDCGPKGSISLRDGNLGLITHHPALPEGMGPVGDRRVSPTALALARQGATSGTYTSRAALDGVERTLSFQKVGDHPFFVSVGLALDDYLAPWRREALKAWGFAGLIALSSLILGLLLHRAWRQDTARIAALSRALAEVQVLQDFLPICMYCKKIRDDQNYWSQLEQYLTTHTGTRFSHGVCPECQSRLQADLGVEEAERP